MALTYCCADGLTGLLSCAVLDEQWLLGQRPGLHLKVPGFEDCLVCKDKVSLLLLDLLDKVVQGESLVFELLHAQGLALRNVPYDHSVLAHTSFAQNCPESHFAQPTFWKASVKHDAPSKKRQVRPCSKVVWVDQVFELFWSQVSLCHLRSSLWPWTVLRHEKTLPLNLLVGVEVPLF